MRVPHLVEGSARLHHGAGVAAHPLICHHAISNASDQRRQRISASPKSGIDRANAVPLYHQIFLALRDDILSGQRPAGSLLPTEHELAEQWGVSRITARRALDELAQQDMVERRRRTGTRVIFRAATPPMDADLDQAVEALIAFGRDTGVRVLSAAQEAVDAEGAAALALAPGASIVRAVRLRLQGDEPLGLVVSQVPAAAAMGRIDAAALAAKPMLALLQELGHRLQGGHQTISALSADFALATTLAIEPRAPVLRIERVVTGAGGAPILRTVAQYRADRYRLRLDLHGRSAPDLTP
ncbi:GntR family transcriptional regulator [Sphingomonas pokkalii]|uniref:GntR family transcriptional regulator n=1 Tax=Sphingomonas pokkalii TaxID=2175090 RepID=A0A2U0SH42_9SPHN|nr:GntR family transcriptional regulator [Sphingomonas pokkalii]